MLTQATNYSAQEWPSLVDAARNGCERSLSEIISRLHGYLLLIANGQTHDQLQAKFGASDIVQNSLMDAYVGIAQFNGSTEAEMRAWLKSIVLHNLLDERRRYTETHSRNIGREQSLESAPVVSQFGADSGISSSISQVEENQKLSQAVKRLPLRQQKVITARHRDGHSYQQIAEHLKITEASARKIWSRALDRLRDLLAE